jgi:hypothetical protein
MYTESSLKKYRNYKIRLFSFYKENIRAATAGLRRAVVVNICHRSAKINAPGPPRAPTTASGPQRAIPTSTDKTEDENKYNQAQNLRNKQKLKLLTSDRLNQILQFRPLKNS